MVPASVLKNVNTSLLELVLVMVGAVADGHLKDGLGQVTDLGVPSAVNMSTNVTLLLAVALTFDMVRVLMLAFNDTVNTVAVAKSRVSVLALMLGLADTSRYVFRSVGPSRVVVPTTCKAPVGPVSPTPTLPVV